MALRNLTNETMVTLSQAWVDPARERKTLQGVPLLSALLPKLEAAHQLLISSLAGGRNAAADRLSSLRDEAEAQDGRHDRKARGIYWLLSGLSELAEAPEDSERLLSLRDRLLPAGLSTITASYSHQAGHVAVVKKGLTAADRSELRRHKTLSGRTLEDELDAWLQAGEALGRIEAERGQLLRGAATADRPDPARARHNWIRVTNALLATLELQDDLSPEVVSRLVGPLREAESRADRRRPAKTEPQPEPAPQPGALPPGGPALER